MNIRAIYWMNDCLEIVQLCDFQMSFCFVVESFFNRGYSAQAMQKNVVSNTDRLCYFNGFPKRFESQKLSFGRSRFSLETLKYFDGKLWKKSANMHNFQINAVRVFVFLYVLFVFISYLNAQVFLQIRRCQLCRSFFLLSR